MKKQYVNPQCEYWCYIGGKLCARPGALRYGPPGAGGGTEGKDPVIFSTSPN